MSEIVEQQCSTGDEALAAYRVRIQQQARRGKIEGAVIVAIVTGLTAIWVWVSQT